MKNIHLIQTDKPSRLVLDTVNNNLFLTTTEDFGTNIMKFQNIYIIHNEEIKEEIKKRDWHLKNDKMITKSHIIDDTCKKIIMTTDQDLINDGVQAISDEFLQWFVMNPSCENVKYIFKYYTPYVYNSEGHLPDETSPKTIHIGYELKIPQEKPNDVVLGYKTSLVAQSLDSHYVDFSNPNADKISSSSTKSIKQETLEEAAESLFPDSSIQKRIFIKGVKSDAARDYWFSKWQQEHRQEVGHSVQVEVLEHYIGQNVLDAVDLIQFLSMNQEFNGYGSVSKETAKHFLEQYKKSKQ